jgi:hypothetical protein
VKKVLTKFSEIVINNMPDNVFTTLSEREMEIAKFLWKVIPSPRPANLKTYIHLQLELTKQEFSRN